jgi:hypothetical protein
MTNSFRVVLEETKIPPRLSVHCHIVVVTLKPAIWLSLLPLFLIVLLKRKTYDNWISVQDVAQQLSVTHGCLSLLRGRGTKGERLSFYPVQLAAHNRYVGEVVLNLVTLVSHKVIREKSLKSNSITGIVDKLLETLGCGTCGSEHPVVDTHLEQFWEVNTDIVRED